MWVTIVGSLVRAGIAFLAGILVEHGLWTPEQAGQYIPYLAGGATTLLIAVALSLYQKLKAHQLLKTAAQLPAGTSIEKVKDTVAWGGGAKLLGGLLLVIALAVPLGACATLHLSNPFKAPATVPAGGEALYTADQVVLTLHDFQKFTIDSVHAGALPRPIGNEIVLWTRASADTIGAVPDGWQAAVRKGWSALRPRLEKLPAVASWLPTIDLAIGFIAPAPITQGGLDLARATVVVADTYFAEVQE